MKRIFAAVLAAGVIAAVPASAQKLVAGLDGTFAPHAMPKLGGGVEGFNVDMAVEIVMAVLWNGFRSYTSETVPDVDLS